MKEPERVVRIQEEILHKIEAIPGVSSVGLSMSSPWMVMIGPVQFSRRTAPTLQVNFRSTG